MFATVGVDIPIEKLMNDWDYLDDLVVKQFASWGEKGQNIIGIRRRQITLKEIIDPVKGQFNSIVMTPEGFSSKQHKALKIHITPGGVPHRVEHSLGFWHINDMDELYLPVPAVDGESLGHFITIMQTPSGKETESFAQYCQVCLTMLHERVYEAGKYGLDGMHAVEDEAIREYNSDAKLRHCPECGHDNPLGYAWKRGERYAGDGRGAFGLVTPYTPAIDIYVGEGDGDWQEASRYHVWTRKFPRSAPPLSLLERHDEGVARVPEQPRVMHRIPAGTPYHIEHLFGFWHKSSNDTLFLRTEIGDDVDYTMIVATTKIAVEAAQWYCPNCGNLLHAEDFDARRFGLIAFWRRTTDRAREFNASAAAACAKCGYVHPASYGFDARTDNDDERQGRTLW